MYTQKNIIYKRKCGSLYHDRFYPKIASYYLYRYTHVRDLGGGGVSERRSGLVSLPPPAWSGASACSGASGIRIGIGIGKRGKMENAEKCQFSSSSKIIRALQIEPDG